MCKTLAAWPVMAAKNSRSFLPGAQLEDAKQLTERMRSQLETKRLAISKSGEEIGKITASFGIA